MGSKTLAALAVMLCATAARAEVKPKVAVMDFNATGASADLATALNGVAATEIDRLGVFKVITTESIRAMLQLEKQQQMMGCSADAACLAEIGGALGVDYIVSGRVTRLPSGDAKSPYTFSLNLTLSNVRKAQHEASDTESAPSEAALMSQVSKGVAKLFAKVLAGKTGTLLISCSEAGATVKVDDTVKGTTPLHGAVTMPGGPHSLLIEKQGFVAYAKDVRVQPGQVTEERVTMVPSPDFIQAYESHAKKMRVGAWISTGVAAAGFVALGGFQYAASQAYNDPKTGFLHYKGLIGTAQDDGHAYDNAQAAATTVRSRETLSYVGAGVGGVAAVSALYFWIAGDDPHRYAMFSGASAMLVPAGGGGAYASVSFGF